MWADLFEPHTRADLDLQQRYLYVAMTRASDVLIVTYSKENEFIEKMVRSGDAMGSEMKSLRIAVGDGNIRFLTNEQVLTL